MQTLFLKLTALSALLFGLPLLGVALNGQPLGLYLEFPPLTRYVEHAPFSGPVFALTAVVAIVLFGAMVLRIRYEHHLSQSTFVLSPVGTWPWWGWLGMASLALCWVLAWSRFDWFADLQWATFTPLWLSYIIVINAWTLRRSGRCLLLNRPAYFAALFPLSALFWWYFEYLNRFVQNWYYAGIEDFSVTRYFLHATLAFSTVLPAVMSTTKLLASLLHPPTTPITFALPTRAKYILYATTLTVSTLGLAGLGIWPDYLFPLLWFAPLLLLLSLQGPFAEPVLLKQLRSHGWQTIYLPALAALLCGFFWELWNFHSAAKWIYSVPFVHRFQIFEMPMLGYTGYLPFGIECAVIASLLNKLNSTTAR
jgi:hypothetical protein